MKIGMKSGQILILVLLIVVVVLTVGLSVASRNITNLRTTTQTEQSERAFSAAEGGVENVLSQLSTIVSVDNPVANVQVPVGNIKAEVNVVASTTYQRPTALGDVAQVNLTGTTASKVKIEWAQDGDPLEVDANGPASIEAAQIYGSDPVLQQRWYFRGSASRNENAGQNPTAPTSTASNQCQPSPKFKGCVVLDILPTARILRIKPFWLRTTVNVSGVGGDLSLQTYDVTSTASTDIGVTRRVQVTRTALPQLPAIFDYVLYSEGDVVK